ncbi:MAG: glycosyltransferase family 2 protein [Candidatus Cloacimonas sp.]|jgi:glycosyltransferase involved in cell wall biosynthesis|nr:glycosyltransferase family 2 protein [Candidatus Cloacimonas sp.]
MDINKEIPPKLSCVLIVKNEAHNIARCLNALGWANEIIVLDTGSTDNTAELCKNLGAKLFYLDNWEGFGKAKQAAVELAQYPWVLSIDADEVVSPELQQAIQTTINKADSYVGYRIKRSTWFITRWIKHCGWDKDYPLRLFRKDSGAFTPDLVHESIKVSGRVGILQEPLLHYSYPSLEQHQTRLIFYGRLWAEEQQRKGKQSSISSAIFHSIWKFISMYFWQKGWLDGKAGLLLSISSAFSVYYKHVRLWELQQKSR